MNQKLKEKILESFSSVLPIAIIVFIISILLVPMSIGAAVLFAAGAALLIIGSGFFSLGAELSMLPMGEGVGAEFTRSKTLWIVIAVCFFLGFIITASEPDLKVLAGQVPDVPDNVLIFTVAVGVGIFLVVAILRILFNIKLAHMLMGFYLLVFILSFISPESFTAVAFDSGGVTTGPMTVPFILSIGIGLAGIRSDKSSTDDSFGLVALCSIGPILSVLLLGILYNPQQAAHTPIEIPLVVTTRDVVEEFARHLPSTGKEVMTSLAPIILFFIIFQIVYRRFKKRQLVRMAVGMLYVFIGLSLFLTGVNVGFIPVGHLIGTEIGDSPFKWLLIPIGIIIGYFIVEAEPAVHILNKQVEEVSCGAIPQKAMRLCLSIGVSASVGLSMLRILCGISIYWYLIPGYIIALALTFFVPKIFTGIAFDAGGVASGPMTSTFLLPFAMGASTASGGDVLTEAFGIVAMVALTPLIAIQVMGVVYGRRIRHAEEELRRKAEAEAAAQDGEDEEILDDEPYGETGPVLSQDELKDLPISAG
ncbi:MAG: DUF1538 domain-containing protein [Clostridiales bacterium]|jgi:hypothetical protein|nr:DUF1538 domain-containing protein [Clostridiales bacterium]